MIKILSKFGLMIMLIVLFTPISSFAADPVSDTGAITISVMDETGADFAGRWYLRQGGSSGYLVRNGTKSETFTFKAGTYYLELQPKYPGYIYYTVFSTNPQALAADGSIKFEAQYFTTEDDLDAAKTAGKPTVIASAATTTTTTSSADSTSTTTSGSSSDTTSSTTTTDTTTKSTTTKKIKYHYVPAATFETPPADSASASAASSSSDSATADDSSASASALSSVPQLAATGPSLILFALAPLLGVLAVRRKK